MGWNRDYLEPPPPPLPEEDQVLPFILGEFEEKYNAAFESSDVESVVDLLHPVVVDVYGPQACADYIQEVIANPVSIKIVNATEIGTWMWKIDDLTNILTDVYRVRVLFTAGGESSEQEIHLIVRDGSLWWLTDCGDPLPTTDVKITLSGYVSLPVVWPEVYLVRWPDGVTVGEKEYLAATCGLDPEEALYVFLDLLPEAGSAPVKEETGEFSLLVSAGSFSFWYGAVYCPDGSYGGFVGSPRTTVSGTEPEVSVGELTDQNHCSCD